MYRGTMHAIDHEILRMEMELDALISLGAGWVNSWPELERFMNTNYPGKFENCGNYFYFGNGAQRSLFITVLPDKVTVGYSGYSDGQTTYYKSYAELDRILSFAFQQPPIRDARDYHGADKYARPTALPTRAPVRRGGPPRADPRDRRLF
jgi:hypothetical protein